MPATFGAANADIEAIAIYGDPFHENYRTEQQQQQRGLK
eukprot:CAMPEP_0185573598 /NCGR_PEP_ID=MMETSP0434-20130131/5268_1 /TAXON_ID=626734 ORGANISM="Favella taraikaensis, Strain Fe Narragansett Bay" /NCGR_SAMPLE_ID=MMETSP0434 /ASSEMBLY_ACC=CAM_ASM_000379 /LENGTH=38 /DNA_ID= /DNA_START= /DNA_END= /DNA_ORIENTATION=